MGEALYIFDFDDTLAHSGANVIVKHSDGTEEVLSSAEFATYVEEPGDELDFSEFDVYPPAGKMIDSTFSTLQSAISTAGIQNVVILTARRTTKPIIEFLKDQGMTSPIGVVGTGSSSPSAKAQYVASRLEAGEYTEVHVYEDSSANINAIEQMLVKDHPGVEYFSTHVQGESVLRNIISRILKEWA
jgi:beta-phosphoglucomutase-like phosphatase (HAD superfamily)